MNLRRLTRISLFSAILSVSVMIVPSFTVPFINLSFTLQVLFVVLIGFVLSPQDAFLSILIYVLAGVLGLPVFSQGRGGLQVILEASGGFIVLFPVVGFLISAFKSKTKNTVKDMLVAILFGIVLLYLFGTAWLSFVLGLNYGTALIAMLVFIPLDLVKIVFAYLIYRRLPTSLFQ